MSDKNVKITIWFKNMDNTNIQNIYNDFNNFMIQNDFEKMTKIFHLSSFETRMVEKENNRELMTEDRPQTYIITKNPISDYDIFKMAIIGIKKWYDSLNIEIPKPSVEIKTSFIKFPLYLRQGKYVPAKTYYDLDLVKPNDQELIDEVNKLLD